LSALAALVALDVPRLCDNLCLTLSQLDSAEESVARLQEEAASLRRNLVFERGQAAQLRALLADAQVRAAAALDLPPERFDEPTRDRKLTEDDRRVIDDPDAR
jgi:hypothetical protein